MNSSAPSELLVFLLYRTFPSASIVFSERLYTNLSASIVETSEPSFTERETPPVNTMMSSFFPSTAFCASSVVTAAGSPDGFSAALVCPAGASVFSAACRFSAADGSVSGLPAGSPVADCSASVVSVVVFSAVESLLAAEDSVSGLPAAFSVADCAACCSCSAFFRIWHCSLF